MKPEICGVICKLKTCSEHGYVSESLIVRLDERCDKGDTTISYHCENWKLNVLSMFPDYFDTSDKLT